ncbi:STAS domain-containing protein [Nocardioides sp. TF02-7]|nr:STAS domain-containing protein [Nocardioides sp. TF02-7]
MFSTQVLKERLDVVVDRGCTDLVLDVSAVSFVDGSALGALDRYRCHVGGRGGRLRVVGADHRFLRNCKLAGYAPLLGRSVPAGDAG